MSTNATIENTYAALEKNGWFKLTGAAAQFSQEEMQTAFSAVQNQVNWKFPIDATIEPSKLCVTVAAIVHFAGSESYVKQVSATKFAIKSPGYYVRIGA